MNNSKGSPPTRQIISELEYGVWKATVFKVALELDVFKIIAKGNHSIQDIAGASKCNFRGMTILLDALCPLGFLSKNNGQYYLTPVSQTYLVRGKDTFYGDWCLQSQIAWDVRVRAYEAVKNGTAVGGDFANVATEDLWLQDYAAALVTWPRSVEIALKRWEKLGISKDITRPLHILDAAAGSGVKSYALAQIAPDVRVTVLDFPKMINLATRVARLMKVEKQVTFLNGNILTTDFGKEKYDIITFGAVLYFFDSEQLNNILTKSYKALKPEGRIVINEPVADEERCQNETALMVAFQLLLFLPHSQVRTFSEYTKALEVCGFSKITQHNETLISAIK